MPSSSAYFATTPQHASTGCSSLVGLFSPLGTPASYPMRCPECGGMLHTERSPLGSVCSLCVYRQTFFSPGKDARVRLRLEYVQCNHPASTVDVQEEDAGPGGAADSWIVERMRRQAQDAQARVFTRDGLNCVDCGAVDTVRDVDGARTCTACGLVLDDHIISDSAEWRCFSAGDETETDRSRVGDPSHGPSAPLELHMAGLSGGLRRAAAQTLPAGSRATPAQVEDVDRVRHAAAQLFCTESETRLALELYDVMRAALKAARRMITRRAEVSAAILLVAITACRKPQDRVLPETVAAVVKVHPDDVMDALKDLSRLLPQDRRFGDAMSVDMRDGLSQRAALLHAIPGALTPPAGDALAIAPGINLTRPLINLALELHGCLKRTDRLGGMHRSKVSAALVLFCWDRYFKDAAPQSVRAAVADALGVGESYTKYATVIMSAWVQAQETEVEEVRRLPTAQARVAAAKDALRALKQALWQRSLTAQTRGAMFASSGPAAAR